MKKDEKRSRERESKKKKGRSKLLLSPGLWHSYRTGKDRTLSRLSPES